ncbi:MAG: GNAT family N-acetyltransferase [Lachnospiraceae bacterium]
MNSMNAIRYTEEKCFTKEQVQDLFSSVGWVSANYPNKLYRALKNSETVMTAWDGDELVGLARAIDDGAILAQVHYVLVRPSYQGRGIAGALVEKIREHYRDFFYIEGMPENADNVPFYERHGFERMAHGAAIQIVNPDFRDDDN